MSKKALIDELTGPKGYATRAEAETAIERVVGGIQRITNRNERVHLTGFGRFEMKERAGRMGRNPATGEQISIAPKTELRFKPAK